MREHARQPARPSFAQDTPSDRHLADGDARPVLPGVDLDEHRQAGRQRLPARQPPPRCPHRPAATSARAARRAERRGHRIRPRAGKRMKHARAALRREHLGLEQRGDRQPGGPERQLPPRRSAGTCASSRAAGAPRPPPRPRRPSATGCAPRARRTPPQQEFQDHPEPAWPHSFAGRCSGKAAARELNRGPRPPTPIGAWHPEASSRSFLADAAVREASSACRVTRARLRTLSRASIL